MVDAVTTEIIRNAFIACAQDMNATLIRSAYTPIIYEGKDCAVALLDENGDVLGQSLGIPLFLGNLEICVKLAMEQLGREAFQQGDLFYENDAYITGTHLNDATIFGPIYWKDRLVGFCATRAHWLDVGGKDPGGSMDSRDIYQEGMRWGPTRIIERGLPRLDLIDLMRRNGRFGSALVGDMNAQVAACRTGEQRFRSVLDRFGYEAFAEARDEIFRQSEQLDREAILALPDGIYEAEGTLDSNGVEDGAIQVKVRVQINGDEMSIDLAGSAPPAGGPINCGFAQTVSACRGAFKLVIQPERPVDGGTFRTLTVDAPQNSIFRASEPAPCQWYFSPLGLLIDLVITALAPVLPAAVAAAHYGDSMVIYVAGHDPRRDGQPFLSVEPTPGGWGAWNAGDGEDGLINIVNGSFKDLPVEVLENRYPISIEQYVIRSDTGGPGKHRGGCGVRRVYRLDVPARVSFWFERSKTPAWGLMGGGQAVGPDVVINPGGPHERHLLKANALPLEAGDIVELNTGGGGGFGKPFEREPEFVRTDVLDGYVTAKAAADVYGVVLTALSAVDKEATLRLREQRPEPVLPVGGSAARRGR